MRRMTFRIANVLEEGRLGGPQIEVARVARGLRDDGLDVLIVLPELQSGDFVGLLEDLQLSYVSLPLRKLAKKPGAALMYVLTFPAEVARIRRVLKRNRISLVHATGGAWQYKAVLAGRLAGAKTVWHLNDTHLVFPLRLVFRFFAFCCADAFVLSGERVKNYYLNAGFGKKELFEIQAPVDTSRFDPDVVDSDAVFSQEEGIKILTVANLNPLKGIEYLAGAVKILQDMDVACTLYILGAVFDSQRAYWKQVQSVIERCTYGSIRCLGSVKDVRPYLAAADVYVCSSVSEASPISVWEAMSMAKPIVSTDVGDVARFVRNQESGIVVASRSPEALAYGIERIVGDPEMAQRMGRTARRIAAAQLDVRVAQSRTQACYWKVIGDVQV